MNRYRGAPTTMESHVGITFPQQGKPSFQPIQPQMRPSSMATGSSTLPFFSFDTSLASTSTYSIPPSIQNPVPFEDEPPLLEELGINTGVILCKTLNILNPVRANADLHEDADLAGPFVLVMLFGLFQLLAGKIQFGVILGWLAVASLFLYFVYNMLAGRYGSLELYRCVSYVGYCLLPMVIFSALQLFLPRNGPTVLVIACLAVIWCTRACATLLVTASPHAEEQRSLIGYACALIYTTFSMLIVF